MFEKSEICILLYYPLCPLMLMLLVDHSCFVGHWVKLWFLFSSICFLLTVGYHLQLQLPDWPCCLHQRKIPWIIRESEREGERGEAGGVGGKGRVL